ncbi:glycerophosphodiester phosphodiesterase family protein [Cohnella lupini]|uniref:Glycerophosphoryl diester phosphodiesterase n=1 Tax=Cohnella lupini TaxID=1294267 RepID=A0A3D9IYY6_9BACL|nr:glycerophosphodiester phosphodiesterase family protein [Cohnella lupini]RED66286.1 glycerophosphoryl diester phosphodiesterase [Cohnella lupini]
MSVNPVVQTPFEKIYTDYLDSNGRVMIAAHRGIWRRASENSLQAIQAAIDLGMDVVEVDIRKTKDGTLVLMHDETVDRMTNGSGKVSELTYQEIRELRLKQGRGGVEASVTNELVPTLREAMELITNKILVNLDKCWDVREDVYRVLLETGTVRQGLFKSAAGMDEVEPFLNGKAERPEFIQIIHDYKVVQTDVGIKDLFSSFAENEELKKWLSQVGPAELIKKLPKPNNELLEHLDELFARIKPKAFELNFLYDRSEIMASETIRRLKERSCRIWVNTMFGWDCGGHTDEISLNNPEFGWDWHKERGANMILSDHPEELYHYLNAGK